MDKAEIKEKLERAVAALMQSDVDLLRRDVNERSITHWLAIHLMPLFPDHDVDCEYNRDVHGGKTIDDFRDVLLGRLSPEEWPTDTDARTVYPDIIVHRRGTNDENLLVVEVKKGIGNAEVEEVKLLGFMTNDRLHYPFAAALELAIGEEAGRHRVCIADSEDLDRKKEGGRLLDWT